MTCSSCKYLCDQDKKEGYVSGYKYYCILNKRYIRGSDCSCSNFEKSYGRSNYECSKIYDEGESFYDDSRSTSSYLIILVLLILLGIVLKIFS